MTEKEKELMYFSMARGMFMGAAESHNNNLSAMFPRFNDDWYAAMNDIEAVKKLAKTLESNDAKKRLKNYGLQNLQ